MKNLSWPSVTLAVIIIVVLIAIVQPDLLSLLSGFISDISKPIGNALGTVKFW